MDVTIIDCGIGNVKSVKRMFEAVDVKASVASFPIEAHDARRLVLPGVGAFDAGMSALNAGWREVLDELSIKRRIPTLGICLGMQLLCRGSEEGRLEGLSWVAGEARRIDTGGDRSLKIPHMGWSEVMPTRDNPLIATAEGTQRFYHVHKFSVVCDDPDTELATATYGRPFTTAVQRDNIFGVQFHPEKSHKFGMALMRRFGTLPC